MGINQKLQVVNRTDLYKKKNEGNKCEGKGKSFATWTKQERNLTGTRILQKYTEHYGDLPEITLYPKENQIRLDINRL